MVTYLNAQTSGLYGTLSELPTGLTFLNTNSTPTISGTFSSIKNAPLITWYGQSNSTLYTGSLLSDLPSTLQTCYIYSNSGITAASIAHLVAIQDLRIYSMGWSQAYVDLVLMSIGNAILANAAHFTYATPSINIGGTNQAPSGTYQAPSGPGGTITSGLEAVWVMVHNVGHAWTVTVTGSGPY
jgi:hypothetical protein